MKVGDVVSLSSIIDFVGEGVNNQVLRINSDNKITPNETLTAVKNHNTGEVDIFVFIEYGKESLWKYIHTNRKELITTKF